MVDKKEFTPITTQADFDAAVKAIRDPLEAKVTELTGKLETARQTAAAKAQEITGLKTRAESAEGTVLRLKVAHENGLPWELADRLKGGTEAELTEDAKTLAGLVKPAAAATPPQVAPLASTESAAPVGVEGALMSMAAAIGGN